MKTQLLIALLVVQFAAISISAQTTAFTYQGSLKDGASPANGNYDFEFKLFDAVSAGAQQGSTLQRLNVAVANGIFTVSLDFGAPVLPGADRFLDIAVRTAGGGAFTPLTPRQQVNSAPYAVRSLNAATADSVTVSGVPAGSGNYIQNSTSPQASSNFNITGTGSADIFNVALQYNIGGNRILGNPGTNNLFAGANAGAVNTGGGNSFFGTPAGLSNTTGFSNSFFGAGAGAGNTSGSHNSFFGSVAAANNTTGGNNSFFGYAAGAANSTGEFNSIFGAYAGYNATTGCCNSLFGLYAGYANTTGNSSSFFGYLAGQANTTGFNNSMFGALTGSSNTTGESNSFFGTYAGISNTTGSKNTVIGYNADVLTGDPSNATAIGADARVDASNSLVLGSISGVNGALSNVNVGIGTTTPLANLHVQNGGTYGGTIQIGALNTSVADRIISFGDTGCSASPSCVYIGERTVDDTMELRAGFFHFINGSVQINNISTAGTTTLCRNASNVISTCSSSLRYKTNIGRFLQGMSFVNQLRPITFDWKESGMNDVGFGAEDVSKIDPRFVTYNDKGEVEGVKYDRLSVAFVNAFREQQEQIEKQQTLIERLEKRLELLEKQQRP